MNIIKVNINGKEYQIKDAEAQEAVLALTKRVEELEAMKGKVYIIDVE